jgi:hypothetical protein
MKYCIENSGHEKTLGLHATVAIFFGRTVTGSVVVLALRRYRTALKVTFVLPINDGNQSRRVHPRGCLKPGNKSFEGMGQGKHAKKNELACATGSRPAGALESLPVFQCGSCHWTTWKERHTE